MVIRSHLVLFLLLSSLVGISYAEDKPGTGRTKDGKAYRTGPDGFRIIDQIAELEVTVDDLRRQIIVLEDELDEKNALLENSQSEVTNKVTEETLIATRPVECREVQMLQETKRELSSCNSLVEQLRASSKAYSKLASSTDNEDVAEQKDVKGLVEDARKSAGIIKAILPAPIEATDSKETVVPKNEEPEEGTGETEEKTSDSDETNKKILEDNRKEFEKKLSLIQEKIGVRKKFLDKVKRSTKGVSISPSLLATSSGISLDKLRAAVASLETSSLEPSQIREGLDQLENLLDEDIETAKRLAKR